VSRAVRAFDDWIRGAFREMNTELEERYFAQEDRANVEGVGDGIKHRLEEEGLKLALPLALEGNTNEGFESAFGVLGNLGLYLGAMCRHGVIDPENPAPRGFDQAYALGMHIGASLGVVPRFATAHLTTHNRAADGVQKSFTTLADEFVFIDYNTMGILSFKRAADALMRIPPLGISNPSTLLLLENARDALRDVARTNVLLFENLDPDRFFYNIRPYYRTYRVGHEKYRGANAGDFSGINEIDLLLGLARANDPFYSGRLVEKMQFMLPEDQASLRTCLIYVPLIDQFLEAAPEAAGAAWFQRNCNAFLEVCAAHGETARQHHHKLFAPFIAKKSGEVDAKYHERLTASGPPLEEVAGMLARLRDLRTAAKGREFETAHDKLETLKRAVSWAG
jgi:monodechloroaminopyrrolnitrin synthase PrnB-like protein